VARLAPILGELLVHLLVCLVREGLGVVPLALEVELVGEAAHGLDQVLIEAVILLGVAALLARGVHHFALDVDVAELADDAVEQPYLLAEAVLGVVVVHELEDVPQLRQHLQLLPVEEQVGAHLAQAHGAEGEGLHVRLVQGRGPVHEALVGLAVADGEHVRQLVARRLYRSVLDLPGDLGGEDADGLVVLGEVGVVASVALDANAPALLGHAEDEGPALLGVEVGVGEHEQALILSKVDVVLEVVEDVPGVVLLNACVGPHARLYDIKLLQLPQIGLHDDLALGPADLGGGESLGDHAAEEDFEDGLHVVHEHPLEVLLLLVHIPVVLLLPQLVDQALVNVPVSHVVLEFFEGLGLLLLILGYPVLLGMTLLGLKFIFNGLVDFLEEAGLHLKLALFLKLTVGAS